MFIKKLNEMESNHLQHVASDVVNAYGSWFKAEGSRPTR